MSRQQVNVKIGSKTHSISNSWNSLFLCSTDEMRFLTATSVFEQLRKDKYKDMVDVRLLSCTPHLYVNGVASGFNASVIREYTAEMERRYKLLSDAMSKNYLHYNERAEEKLKLSVLIVEGLETAIGKPEYDNFSDELDHLVRCSRAAGIHVISFVNEIPRAKNESFKYYGEPINILRKEFLMKNVTNSLLCELYRLGFTPTVDLSYDEEKKSIAIEITLTVQEGILSFNLYYDAHYVSFALSYPCKARIDIGANMEIYRTLRTDASLCFEDFRDNHLGRGPSLIGTRYASEVTPPFIHCLMEEIYSLAVIEKLKKLKDS